jgi:hypothetical protein
MTQIAIMLASIVAVLVGGIIGAGFGIVQNAARRKNEEKQRKGELNSGWAVMPGSGTRVAYFLVVLLAIQFICPLLFRDGTQWWVTGGVGLGYGVMLFLQLRQRLLGHK